MGEHVQREILPIPDRDAVNLTTYDAKDPDTSFPPSRCGHRRAHRTYWWCCSTTSGSVRRTSYCYNLLGLRRFKVHGDTEIPAGEHQVRVEFAYDGGGLGKGGTVTLYLDGKQVGEGRVDGTQPMIFSGDETTDVGSDTATPVSDDYNPRTSAFTGRIRWVQIDLGDDAEDADHLISPEELLRVAMSRQ
jgi:hypothetical protein